MDRKECETLIIYGLKMINSIYHQYNPQGTFLSLTIHEDDTFSIFNAYWEEDKDYPIQRNSYEEKTEIE